MLQLGLKITQPADPLEKITLERLFLGLSKPKQEFRDLILQLRTVAALDTARYRELKKQLPYFVCGIFQPPVRRKEHFAAIRYFIIDLDHLAGAGVQMEELRQRLKEMEEVALVFASPGGDGLKVLFRLEEDCRDAAMFSAFYKVFAHRFAERFGVQGAIDLRTHDVTRACFMSYDPETYFNPLSALVKMEDYLKELDYDQAREDVREAEKALAAAATARPQDEEKGPALDDEILRRIKERINPALAARPQKQYHVPPQLDEAMPLIHEKLAEMELEILLNEPISYGRKLHIGAGKHFAEINLFYGQRGFKVVKTTKTGSNAELADLAARALESIIYNHIIN
ncbi:MAG: hypothetical protein IPN20_03235 [Haliscomenobacter sp.]|nr:hypothetical protein [Haliscomenobacter sp.]